MADAKCSDEEFMRLFKELGPTALSKHINVTLRNVFARRKRIEKRTNVLLSPPSQWASQYPARVPLTLENGILMIGSDAHYWPGLISTAHRGFVKLAKELNPKIIVLNGDVIDGATISRHSPIGWEKKPSLKEEKEEVYDRTIEIIKAAPKADHYWTLGNHCMRFENKLSQDNSQFRDIDGFTLAHHFPLWKFAMSLWVNDELVIKHRFKGGIHATHNNILWSGKSMATGHLHSLKVTPFSDYNGIRYGMDSGTLADPYGPHASYGEDNPLNHRSGFLVITFVNGRLMWPEIVAVVDADHIEFRGQLIEV